MIPHRIREDLTCRGRLNDLNCALVKSAFRGRRRHDNRGRRILGNVVFGKKLRNLRLGHNIAMHGRSRALRCWLGDMLFLELTVGRRLVNSFRNLLGKVLLFVAVRGQRFGKLLLEIGVNLNMFTTILNASGGSCCGSDRSNSCVDACCDSDSSGSDSGSNNSSTDTCCNLEAV